MSEIPKRRTDRRTPRHYRGTQSAADLQTEPFRIVQAVLPRIVELAGMVAVFGAAGTGKSFAVDYFIEHADAPNVWLDLPGPPKGKELAIRLLEKLGAECDRSAPIYALVDDLTDALADFPGIMVVNEAQNSGREGLELLRYCHERPDARWTLVVIGCGLEKVVGTSRELVSRFNRAVEFHPLTTDEIVPLLQQYHPLFAATDPSLLVAWDERLHGVLREWAKYLEFLLGRPAASRTRPPTERTFAAFLAANVFETGEAT